MENMIGLIGASWMFKQIASKGHQKITNGLDLQVELMEVPLW